MIYFEEYFFALKIKLQYERKQPETKALSGVVIKLKF